MTDEPKPESPTPEPKAPTQMPKYQSHEVVHALEIESVVTKTGGWVLHFKEPECAPRDVAGQWFRTHSPDLAEADGGMSGGYFVTYSSGEEAWLSKAEFEANYTRI